MRLVIDILHNEHMSIGFFSFDVSERSTASVSKKRLMNGANCIQFISDKNVHFATLHSLRNWVIG